MESGFESFHLKIQYSSAIKITQYLDQPVMKTIYSWSQSANCNVKGYRYKIGQVLIESCGFDVTTTSVKRPYFTKTGIFLVFSF